MVCFRACARGREVGRREVWRGSCIEVYPSDNNTIIIRVPWNARLAQGPLGLTAIPAVTVKAAEDPGVGDRCRASLDCQA